MSLMRNKWLVVASLTMVLAVGCKKEQKAAVAEELILPLQPGIVFMGAQMEGNTIWINSFDPKTNACLLRHYDLKGELIPGSPRIRLKGCRIETLPSVTKAG